MSDLGAKFPCIKFSLVPWPPGLSSEASGNKAKETSRLSYKNLISFVLFPKALEPSKNFIYGLLHSPHRWKGSLVNIYVRWGVSLDPLMVQAYFLEALAYKSNPQAHLKASENILPLSGKMHYYINGNLHHCSVQAN